MPKWGIQSALFLLPPPEKGECPRSTRAVALEGQDPKDGFVEVQARAEGSRCEGAKRPQRGAEEDFFLIQN